MILIKKNSDIKITHIDQGQEGRRISVTVEKNSE